MSSPQKIVSEALLNGTSRVTRRAEVYEADGVTIFADSKSVPRVIDGNVSVDMSRDERRSLDITFDNSDGLFKHDPDGFWYDKIIKVFRGTDWTNTNSQPKILIIEDVGTYHFDGFLRSLGFTDITSYTGPVSFGDTTDYDIIVDNGGSSAPAKYDVIQQAYNAGASVLTISDSATEAHVPLILTSIAKSDSAAWSCNTVAGDNFLSGSWTSFSTQSTSTGTLATSLAVGVVTAATYTWSSIVRPVMFYQENALKGRWFHSQIDLNPTLFTSYEGNYRQIMHAVIEWLYTAYGPQSWETQIGEFMVDRIDEPRFPSIIKCTGRDYTKKLLKTKFSEALTFSDGTSIDTVIAAIAANGGITKHNLNSQDAVLNGSLSFDRTAERWAAIRGLAEAAAVEVYFDSYGYLTTRPMQDPSLSPATLLLATGKEYGNLVDWAKSSNDSRLYNRVIITSENQDSVAENTYGLQVIVANTEPSSPTRVDRIGERDYFYTSSFFTSLEQMQMYAERLLKIVALEEYALNFSVVPFYWSEAGDIIEFADPNAGVDEPTRFLMSDFSIPLALGTMSGNAKRVTIVGQAT